MTQSAANYLQDAISTLEQRGKQYDKPEGERSMADTVKAFNAITGGDMTISAGWMFMCVLKQVRTFAGETPHADSMLDLIAYSALLAESAA
jgi:hypothetical protein